MTRLDAALAEIARRRALAQAATPGPWVVAKSGSIDAGRFDTVLEGGPVDCMSHCYGGTSTLEWNRAADVEHIAANDPAHVLAVLDAAEATLRRHRREEASPYCCCGWCSTSQHTAPWPCPDAAAVLDLYAPEDLLERDGAA